MSKDKENGRTKPFDEWTKKELYGLGNLRVCTEILDMIESQERDANGEFVLSDGEVLDSIHHFCKGVFKEFSNLHYRFVDEYDKESK
jgi:hypothetical protein